MKRYSVYVLPRVRVEIDRLPGHVRQRVRRVVIELRDDPEASRGKRLDYAVAAGKELWRVRLDNWRIVYLVDQDSTSVYVLAVRRRPPYQYQDLGSLLAELG